MPHAVITGDVELVEVFDALQPVLEKTDHGVLKTTGRYLSHDGRAVIVEALAIDGDAKQPFLAMIDQRDDGAVIRLHPSSADIEKTDGIKRVLASLAEQLLAMDEAWTLGETNLADHLTS